jgi:hypothetical protein
MSIARLARNAGFGLAALAIVLAVGLSIEYEPILSSMAR